MSLSERYIKKALLTAAQKGGRILRRHFYSRDIRARTKSSNWDLVTNVDLMIQERVIETLGKRFPDTPIVSEEKENTDTDGDVIFLDPLDGTLNFVHGYRECAVSIAYWQDHQPLAGVVYNPIDNVLFYAFRGRGSYRNGKPIRTSNTTTLQGSLLITGWPYDKGRAAQVAASIQQLYRQAQEIRSTGSSALSLCNVACGIFDSHWEWDLFPWDMAAGILVVQEAGGMVTSLDGRTFDLESGEILASNGNIHQEMVNVLMPLLNR
jgi:myo-inositol-1(or 4)-monophosphatase